ncbi:hypothetical protein KXD40_009214 [Peronospora effusa]|nr:hypothetical protein KXD40_009214 [Peronospora effusa]
MVLLFYLMERTFFKICTLNLSTRRQHAFCATAICVCLPILGTYNASSTRTCANLRGPSPRIELTIASLQSTFTIRTFAHTITCLALASGRRAMEFSASSADTTATASLPFKCPPSLFKDEAGQDHLCLSLPHQIAILIFC